MNEKTANYTIRHIFYIFYQNAPNVCTHLRYKVFIEFQIKFKFMDFFQWDLPIKINVVTTTL